MRNIMFLLAPGLLLAGLAGTLHAQVTPNDTIAVGSGYANDVFYNLENGAVATVSRTNWDLAFSINPTSGILVNTTRGVTVYRTQYSASQWAVLDSAGQVRNQNRLINNPADWLQGALNTTASGSFEDVGWGLYDISTHVITGDSLYIVRLSSTDYRKLQIIKREAGVYSIRYANLDGSAEVNANIPTAGLGNRLFTYYSFVTQAVLDREPDKADWDLVFTRYSVRFPQLPPTDAQQIQSVAGIFSNPAVSVAEVTTLPADRLTADTAGAVFADAADVIGYDWKAFTGTWSIADTTVYFVKSQAGNVWRLVFTGFTGTGTGEYFFYKTPVGFLNALGDTWASQALLAYPNPATQELTLSVDYATPVTHAQVSLLDLSGRTVLTTSATGGAGLQAVTFSVGQLPAGWYTAVWEADGRRGVTRVAIVR